MKFIDSLSSQLTIANLMSSNISLTQSLISLIESVNVVLENMTINDINTTYSFLLAIARSSVNQIKNMTIHDINVAALILQKSNVTNIDNLHVYDVIKGVFIQESSIGMLQNNRISRSGSTSILQGGALLIKNSNSTIQNNTFEYNVAQSGGAIYID